MDASSRSTQRHYVQDRLQRPRKAYARDEIRELIFAQEKAERDELSRLEYAKSQGREEGREEERKRTEQEKARAALAEAELARVKEELEALRRR